MAGGIIYTKTIDPSVQDGLDNNLIIQPNYAYQKKFGFGDDWNEIIIGMFLSYTYSETNDNAGAPNTQDYNAGGTTKDTNGYIGIIKESESHYLPQFDGITASQTTKCFIGPTYSQLNYEGSFYRLTSYNNNQDQVNIISSSNIHFDKYGSSSSDNTRRAIQIRSDGSNTTGFSNFIGLGFKLVNKGSSGQRCLVNMYASDDFRDNDATDISLTRLKQLINAQPRGSKTDLLDASIELNDGSNPTELPDSFIFYNPFLTIRPRIHAVAVKKIS